MKRTVNLIMAFVIFSSLAKAQNNFAAWKNKTNNNYQQWSSKQDWKHNYFEWKKQSDDTYQKWKKQSGWNENTAMDSDNFSPEIEVNNEQIENIQNQISTFQNENNQLNEGNQTEIERLNRELALLRAENNNLQTQVNQVVKISEFKIWAVVVGISYYRNEKARLKYCDDDAYKIYGFLKSPEGGALPEERMILLIDEEATGKSIRKAISEFAQKAAPDDAFLFYYSGHGSPNALLGEDFAVNTEGMVTHQFINQQIGKSKAKNTFCIIDACHSGNIGQNQKPENNTGVPTYEVVYYTPEIREEDKTYKTIAAMEATEQFYQALTQAEKGSVFILSSKGEETSLEIAGKRQGIFSYFFIKGLEGEADYNNDQIISVTEIFDFTRKKVTDYTKNTQTPIMTGQYTHTMPLAVIRK